MIQEPVYGLVLIEHEYEFHNKTEIQRLEHLPWKCGQERKISNACWIRETTLSLPWSILYRCELLFKKAFSLLMLSQLAESNTGTLLTPCIWPCSYRQLLTKTLGQLLGSQGPVYSPNSGLRARSTFCYMFWPPCRRSDTVNKVNASYQWGLYKSGLYLLRHSLKSICAILGRNVVSKQWSLTCGPADVAELWHPSSLMTGHAHCLGLEM